MRQSTIRNPQDQLPYTLDRSHIGALLGLGKTATDGVIRKMEALGLRRVARGRWVRDDVLDKLQKLDARK